jgi:hypothetical protein
MCAVSGCSSKYNPEWGQDVRKPMYRGAPTLDSLRPSVRLADAVTVPPPNFRRMTRVVEEEKTGTVYRQLDARLIQFANGYSQLHESGVRPSSCNPIDTFDAVSYAGLLDVMRTTRVVAPRCPSVADNNNWLEMTEIVQVSGRIFPLAVGNRLTFSGRMLTRSDSGVERSSPLSAVTRNPLTDEEGRIMSEREAPTSYVFEVVSRLPSYQPRDGKEVGEVYVIRKTFTVGDAAPLTYDVYFSTLLNWPVLIKQDNGVNVKAIDWE